MVIWTEPAKIDLQQIFQFIARDSRHYARKTIDQIIERTVPLIQNPRIGRVVPEYADENIREIIVYSYRVIYEVTDNDLCAILAVAHVKQDISPP